MSRSADESASGLAEAVAGALREAASRLKREKTAGDKGKGRKRPELKPETVLRFLTFFGGRDA